VRHFLRESDAFEIDLERERHLATYNPQGFLRRRATG
jgi:cephalosporin hydroxylase